MHAAVTVSIKGFWEAVGGRENVGSTNQRKREKTFSMGRILLFFFLPIGVKE